MSTIHWDIEQNTPEWLSIRAGKVTASELKNLLTPQFKIRTGETPHTYLCRKVAESILGAPLDEDDFATFDTEQGQMKEDEARALFVFEYANGQRVKDAGFITHDDGRFGCSPDALVGENGGLEIKCPKLKTHVKYLIDGELPEEYATQVHGSMYASGRSSWNFMSYARPTRKFPPFVLTVERDEAIQAKIAEALASFYAKFDAAMLKLKEAA